MVVYIKIGIACFGRVDRSDVLEIKPKICQFGFGNFCFSRGIQCSQYFVIFLETVVGISNQILGFRMYFVVEGISTVIRAKLFV